MDCTGLANCGATPKSPVQNFTGGALFENDRELCDNLLLLLGRLFCGTVGPGRQYHGVCIGGLGVLAVGRVTQGFVRGATLLHPRRGFLARGAGLGP
jgi:hypothetical protein